MCPKKFPVPRKEIGGDQADSRIQPKERGQLAREFFQNLVAPPRGQAARAPS
jgi:hypothetical protein